MQNIWQHIIGFCLSPALSCSWELLLLIPKNRSHKTVKQRRQKSCHPARISYRGRLRQATSKLWSWSVWPRIPKTKQPTFEDGHVDVCANLGCVGHITLWRLQMVTATMAGCGGGRDRGDPRQEKQGRKEGLKHDCTWWANIAKGRSQGLRFTLCHRSPRPPKLFDVVWWSKQLSSTYTVIYTPTYCMSS